MTQDRRLTPHLLRLEEAGDYLRLSRRSLYRLLQSGQLRWVRVSPASRRIRFEDLTAFIEAQRTQPKPK